MDRYTDYYHVLKAIEGKPDISQRKLSLLLGCSLGKVNFIMKALMDKGVIKMERFVKSKNKMVYAYILTPRGINEKTKITKHFIERKSEEFEKLKIEIEEAENFLSESE